MELTMIMMSKEEAQAQANSYLRIPERDLTTEDRALLVGYLALAQGKPVIDIARAVVEGGVDENGYPRLALGRADWAWCNLYTSGTSRWDAKHKVMIPRFDGFARVTFQQGHWPHHRAEKYSYAWPLKTSTLAESRGAVRSAVPIIPPEIRPRPTLLRRHLVLWEVEEWAEDPSPSADPVLIRPLGHGLGTIEATWDLTPLELAVLGGRE